MNPNFDRVKMEKQTVLLGSIYTFHDAQGLIDELRPVQGAAHTVCKFDTVKQQFKATFEAADGEKAVSNLSKTMLAYAEADDGIRDADEGEIVPLKVSLVSDAQIKAELDALYSDVDRIVQQEQEAAAFPQEQPLFAHENIKQSWTISPENDLVMYTKVLLGDIAQATGTRVERDGRNINVYADTPELVELVRKKLSNCEEAFVSLKRGFLRFDFHADEKATGHSFRFRHPTRTVDQDINKIPRFAARYYEVVMCYYSSTSQSYPAVSIDATAILPEGRSVLWPTCFSFEFGEWPKTNRLLQQLREEPLGVLAQLQVADGQAQLDKRSQIKTWRNKLEDPDRIDVLDEIEGRNLSAGPKRAENVSENVPRAARYNNRSLLDSLNEEMETPFTDMPLLLGPNIGQAPTISNPQMVANKAPVDTVSMAPPAKIDKAYLSGVQTNGEAQKPDAVRAEPSVRLSKSTTAAPLSRPAWTDGKWSLPATQSRGLRLQGPPKQKSRPQLPIPPELSASKGSTIRESEKEMRRYHPQGPQRAAPAKCNPKPFELPSEVWKSLLSILNTPRLSGTTEIALKMEIGRLFIEAASIPEQWHCGKHRPANAFSPGQWADIFHAHRAKGFARTTFMPRLTDYYAEAEYLIELEIENGVSLFVPPPHPKSEEGRPEEHIRLVIHCIDNQTGVEAFIEVDENEKVSIHSPSRPLGNVNLHFPRRAWDARFLIEEEALQPVSFVGPFNSIVKSLWVGGPKTPEDFARPVVVSTKDASIEIKSVQIHQDVIYLVNSQAFEGLEMHLTQVVDLRVSSKSTCFAAYAAEEENLRKNGQIWWQMAIRSPIVETQLRDAIAKLGVGEKGSFEYHTDIEEHCKCMLSVAEMIVARMDSIGIATYFQQPTGAGSSSPRKRSHSSRAGQSLSTSRRVPSHESSRFRSESIQKRYH